VDAFWRKVCFRTVMCVFYLKVISKIDNSTNKIVSAFIWFFTLLLLARRLPVRLLLISGPHAGRLSDSEKRRTRVGAAKDKIFKIFDIYGRKDSSGMVSLFLWGIIGNFGHTLDTRCSIFVGWRCISPEEHI